MSNDEKDEIKKVDIVERRNIYFFFVCRFILKLLSPAKIRQKILADDGIMSL